MTSYVGQIYDVTDPWPDTHIWLVYLPRKHKRQKNLQASILFHRSDLVFLLPPWPYSICLYSWRAWEPTPLQSSTQSYRRIPRLLTRPTPLPDFRQRSSTIRPWDARGTVRWWYPNSTVRQKDSLPQLIATMEQAIASLDAWFHCHGLKVNTGKTELILFGSRQNCRGLDPISIRFREDMIREGPTVRNLGVVFDKHLTWDSHVSALLKKCNGILIGLSHVRHQIPSDLLPTLVNALVLSHVRYCLAVFGNGSEKNIQRLQKVLNFALRTVSGRRKFEHISDVREDLGSVGWPSARQLYEQHSLNFLHKICCTGEPEALSSQLQVNSTLRSRSTRQDADLALPRVRTEAGRRRLLFSIVQLNSYESLRAKCGICCMSVAPKFSSISSSCFVFRRACAAFRLILINIASWRLTTHISIKFWHTNNMKIVLAIPFLLLVSLHVFW